MSRIAGHPSRRLALLFAGLPFAPLAQPAGPRFRWQRATAAEVGIDPTMPDRARAAFARLPRLTSFGLVRDGKLIFEHYQNNVVQESFSNIASVTKSIVALLVGIALDKGFIRSVEQPIGDFFPENSSAEIDPKAHSITLAHLLSMSAGWTVQPSDEPPENPLDALKRRIAFDPGTQFQYDNASSHLIAIALGRALGEPLENFAERHLFEPLDCRAYLWGRDNQARVLGWHRMQFTLRDLLKFGQLVLDEGEWQGRRIVSADWIAAMLTERNPGAPPVGLPYGYLWYIARTPDRRHRAVMGIGYGGQFLYVVPDLRTAIAFTHTRDQRNADLAFMREIVMPAIRP